MCKEESATVQTPLNFTYDFDCKYCGAYRITEPARHDLGQPDNDALARDLASYVCEQRRYGGTQTTVNNELILWFRTYPRPRLQRRIELFLDKAFDLLGPNISGRINLADPALRVASWSRYNNNSVAIGEYLTTLGALDPADPSGTQRIVTAKAHLLAFEWAKKRGASGQVFVAMWFHKSLRQAYDDGISRAIINSGYTPRRVDRTEHADRIDDEVIAEIRRSAFVVADFTEHRPNVYYEAGFAHGLGRRVIFTCRENSKGLHFDVRQYNTIEWKTPADLIAPLQNRILALFGAGPLKLDAAPIHS